MSKLSKRDRTLLLVIGLFVALGGTYWFYVKPAKTELATTTEAAQQAQDNVTTLQGELAKLTAQQTKPSTVPIAAELRLAKAYPYSESIPELILQIEELAEDTDVDLGELTPAAGTDYAGVTGTPFTIGMTGKFWDVQDFLYRVHNHVRVGRKGELVVNGRMLAVTKADLKSAEGEEATTGPAAEISANITVLAFSRTPGGGAAAAPAGGAAPAPSDTAAAGTTGGNS